MKNKKCKNEGCTNPVWSGGLCKNHIGRKPIKQKKFTFKTGKLGKEMVEKAMLSQSRHKLFKALWRKRGPKSEVSGQKLFGEASSAYFHHILPKSKFPMADLDPENIIILTMDEHADVENDMFKFEEINERRKILLKKYNLI